MKLVPHTSSETPTLPCTTSAPPVKSRGRRRRRSTLFATAAATSTKRRVFGNSGGVAPPRYSGNQPTLHADLLPSVQPTTNTITTSRLRHDCPEFIPAALTSSTGATPSQVPPGYPFHPSQIPQERSIADMFGIDEGESYDDDLADIEGIWQHVLHSDDEADSPVPCSCHNMAVGSCPEFLKRVVEQISHCRQFAGPNMDGAKSPL